MKNDKPKKPIKPHFYKNRKSSGEDDEQPKKPGVPRMVKTNHVFINAHTVYVRNLSYERNIQGIKTIFSKYGTVKYVKIVVDPQSLRSLGMAFVEMGDVTEAKKAIEGINNNMIDGRTVKASPAIPQAKKPEKPKRAKRPERNDRDRKDVRNARSERPDRRPPPLNKSKPKF